MTVIWLALSLLTGCGGGEGLSIGTPPAEECDLDLGGLEGKVFVMSEAQPDKTYKDNIQARMKFEKGENGLEVKYTAMSISDVYTYYCQEPKAKKGEDGEETFEMYCGEEERPKDWCQALEVVEEGSCNRKALRKLGITTTSDDDIKKAIKEARAEVKKYRGTENWKRFVLNNNNLGNKLQGRLYVKVDSERCRLSISDMYFTIHNGKGLEDTNPVGINPFVETDESLMFQHCHEGKNVVADLNVDTAPKDGSKVEIPKGHELGQPVYYFYYGEKENKAVEGCTYSADIWANWKLVKQDLPITPEDDGHIFWMGSHTWESDNVITYMGKDAAVYEMVRHKQCDGGEKEQINTICNVFLF